ncbi:hypothetical protein M378DRAFT_192471 [Amanita muscaria Koide BX008]|uniref:Urea transporter n=1 Tax=Amanita muscaria (strain Koide BX008) TaxID=946122 RepID=A0A0C2X8R9_AMAMK|nr:hypothetical protein M378DRAFT_192471 [Amanita muscaria Koide BX008]
MSTTTPILPQGVGYGVVMGIGLFFSVFMIGITALQARYTEFSPDNSEEFSSASRSVKPGLIASGIVSAWTMAGTVLQSSAVAYKYGISGPWWYGAGATVQILLFAMLAAKLKLNAPYAHTWLEIVGARWGRVPHLICMFFGLATNVIITAQLIVGGSATVTDLTGMHTVAACFLIPTVVAIYVVVGGMRSTLLCDYSHTTVLFVVILFFFFTVYATSPKIGSPSAMYDLLQKQSAINPVDGNAQGSYLTMRSTNGIIFGVINIVGNFATVFQDQAYWQRAIASRPASTVKAYLLGGLAWFAIPFTLSTTLGLAAVALRGDPSMKELSPLDVSTGLPAAAAVSALLGKSGATALLILLFLAVTSSCSAELIAVSSVLTYDVYKTYINPQATEERILQVGHLMVILYALVCSIAGLIFYYIGVSLGWLYTFMGVILGSGAIPTALCVTWNKANKWGCIGGSLIGSATGVITWLVTTAKLNNGVLNVTTTGGDYEMLAGNVASFVVGGVIATVISLLCPEDFDWAATRAINAPVKPDPAPKVPEEDTMKTENESSNGSDVKPASISEISSKSTQQDDDELNPGHLQKAFVFASVSSIALFVIFILLIPLPLFGAQTVYTPKGYTAWVAISIAWVFLSIVVVVIYPVLESRHALMRIAKGVYTDLFTKKSGKFVPRSNVTV